MIITNVYISGDDVFYGFVNFISVIIWKSIITFLEFLLVFDSDSTFEFFYVIYILVGFNHIYMVINIPFNELGWSFTPIVNQAIISFEPILN